MCARAGARSVAAMTARSIPVIALVALGATAGPARAAGFVYGGTTRDGHAIVITAPKGAAKDGEKAPVQKASTEAVALAHLMRGVHW